MATRERLGALVETRRANAALSWLLVLFVGVVVLDGVRRGDLLWAGFAAVLAAVALLPAAVFRDPLAMLPWEVLVLAALPLIGRSFATVPLTSHFATYLSVAAFALVLAVELQVFSPVRLTPGFAVLFVVVTTMATAGIWAVARWSVDVAFGTTFLLVPGRSGLALENRLMWEFVWSTAAGVVAGLVFEGYFRRRARRDHRRG